MSIDIQFTHNRTPTKAWLTDPLCVLGCSSIISGPDSLVAAIRWIVVEWWTRVVVVTHRLRTRDNSTVVVVVSSAINIIINVAAMVVPPPSISRATKGPTQLQRCLFLPISNLRARSSNSHSNNNSSRVNIVLNPKSHQMATSRTPSNILRKE